MMGWSSAGYRAGRIQVRALHQHDIARRMFDGGPHRRFFAVAFVVDEYVG